MLIAVNDQLTAARHTRTGHRQQPLKASRIHHGLKPLKLDPECRPRIALVDILTARTIAPRRFPAKTTAPQGFDQTRRLL